jgi:hypothetical protein
MLTSGGVEMAQKYMSTVIHSAFYQGAHRATRLQAYQLLRQMHSFFKVDFNEMLGTMIQDA